MDIPVASQAGGGRSVGWLSNPKMVTAVLNAEILEGHKSRKGDRSGSNGEERGEHSQIAYLKLA